MEGWEWQLYGGPYALRETAKTVIIVTELYLYKPDSLENIVTGQWDIVAVVVVQATSPEFHPQ